jgi:hypothetical protein
MLCQTNQTDLLQLIWPTQKYLQNSCDLSLCA